MSVGVAGSDSIGADIGSTTRSMTWSTPWSVTVLLSRAWPVSVPRSALTDVLSSFDGLEPSSLGCCGACSGLGLASASGREPGAGLSGASVDEVGSLTVFFAFRLTVWAPAGLTGGGETEAESTLAGVVLETMRIRSPWIAQASHRTRTDLYSIAMLQTAEDPFSFSSQSLFNKLQERNDPFYKWAFQATNSFVYLKCCKYVVKYWKVKIRLSHYISCSDDECIQPLICFKNKSRFMLLKLCF